MNQKHTKCHWSHVLLTVRGSVGGKHPASCGFPSVQQLLTAARQPSSGLRVTFPPSRPAATNPLGSWDKRIQDKEQCGGGGGVMNVSR